MDVAVPEAERRTALLQELVKKGFVVEMQQSGFVRAKKPKEKFSILLFLVLLAMGGIGILYAIWYAFQKDDVKQFIIPV